MATALGIPAYQLFKETKNPTFLQEEIELLGAKTSEFVIKELERILLEK